MERNEVAGTGDAPKRRKMQVEVAYALPDEQVILAVEVEEGTTAADAVLRSGIQERFPEINLDTNKLGIFGKLTKPDQPLRPRDRVEVYRPLIADPKAVRKQRAAEGKAMKKGGGEEKQSNPGDTGAEDASE